MKNRWSIVAATIGSLALAAGAAHAQGHDSHDHEHDRGNGHEHAAGPHEFHGDISRFHEHDWSVWRGGRWEHGQHGGRAGWWWIAGGTWYFYPYPVYPWPNPYEPPPATIVAPPVDAPPPPAQNWYWCEAPRGYYPYVPSCPGGWKAVPAAASAPPAPPLQ